MNKDFLKGISKENKKDFLTKLQSGGYELLPVYDLPKQLVFDLIPGSMLFKCKQDGRELTREQISNLQGYIFGVSVVSNRLQVSGEKLPSKIIMIPFCESEYLNSLLKKKNVTT